MTAEGKYFGHNFTFAENRMQIRKLVALACLGLLGLVHQVYADECDIALNPALKDVMYATNSRSFAEAMYDYQSSATSDSTSSNSGTSGSGSFLGSFKLDVSAEQHAANKAEFRNNWVSQHSQSVNDQEINVIQQSIASSSQWNAWLTCEEIHNPGALIIGRLDGGANDSSVDLNLSAIRTALPAKVLKMQVAGAVDKGWTDWTGMEMAQPLDQIITREADQTLRISITTTQGSYHAKVPPHEKPIPAVPVAEVVLPPPECSPCDQPSRDYCLGQMNMYWTWTLSKAKKDPAAIELIRGLRTALVIDMCGMARLSAILNNTAPILGPNPTAQTQQQYSAWKDTILNVAHAAMPDYKDAIANLKNRLTSYKDDGFADDTPNLQGGMASVEGWPHYPLCQVSITRPLIGALPDLNEPIGVRDLPCGPI